MSFGYVIAVMRGGPGGGNLPIPLPPKPGVSAPVVRLVLLRLAEHANEQGKTWVGVGAAHADGVASRRNDNEGGGSAAALPGNDKDAWKEIDERLTAWLPKPWARALRPDELCAEWAHLRHNDAWTLQQLLLELVC